MTKIYTTTYLCPVDPTLTPCAQIIQAMSSSDAELQCREKMGDRALALVSNSTDANGQRVIITEGFDPNLPAKARLGQVAASIRYLTSRPWPYIQQTRTFPASIPRREIVDGQQCAVPNRTQIITENWIRSYWDSIPETNAGKDEQKFGKKCLRTQAVMEFTDNLVTNSCVRISRFKVSEKPDAGTPQEQRDAIEEGGKMADRKVEIESREAAVLAGCEVIGFKAEEDASGELFSTSTTTSTSTITSSTTLANFGTPEAKQ